MALEKQSVSISFNKGVDTKTDSKQLVPGKLLNLENVILKKVGKFVKRNGYGVLASSTSLSNGNALATFKNELLAFDGSTISSYSSFDDKLYSKGTKVAVDIAVQSIARNSYEQTAPDSATHSVGISVFAWQDSSGGVRYSVFDNTTQQAVLSNILISATGSKPKVKTIGSNILIFYIDGSSLKYYKINSASPTTVYATVTLVTIGSYYDVSLINSKLIVAYSTGTTTGVFSLDSALIQSASTVVSEASSCLSVFGDTSNNVWIAYNSGNNLKVFIRDSALTGVVLAPTVIEAGAAPYVNVAGIYDGTGKLWYEVTGDISSNQYVKFNTCSVSGTVGTASVFLRSVGLYSKPFIVSGSVYITVTHDSDLQPTYFVTNGSGSVVAKVAPSLGGGLSASGLLAEVSLISSNNYLIAYEFKDFVQSVAGDVTTQTGINAVTLKFAQPILSSEIGNNLHTSGGIISSYDGQNINELGFSLYPEIIEPTYIKNGGTLQEGSYLYTATYEWTDSQGQIHRSAPYSETLDIAENLDYITYYPPVIGTTYAIMFDQDPSTGTFTGSVDEALQKLYIGKKVSIPGVPSAYVTAIVDFRLNTVSAVAQRAFVYLNTSFSGGSGFKTVTTYPQFFYPASSTIGSSIVNYKEVPFNCYTGTVANGSNTIYMSNTKGLVPKMRLVSSGGCFPLTASSYITDVYDDRIVMNTTSTAALTNGIFYFVRTLQVGAGTVNSIVWNESIRGTMDFFIGQKLYYYADSANLGTPENQAGFIFNITGGSGIYTITFNTSLNTNQLLVAGLYANQDLYEQQQVTISANYTNPVTIEGTNNVVGEANEKTVDVNKVASATGDVVITIDNFASPAISVDTLRVTEKENAVINIYRTAKNGTVSYQVTPVNGIPNDPTVDSISFVDSVPDEQLIGNAQLYTTGGEVENIAPPAGDIVSTFKNRLLVVPNEDPISFWYSKQVRTNTPIEFNDSFIQRVPEKGGAITALQQMDDKLLIFKQDYVFVMVGDGASVSGVNNDFTDPQLITADCGCRDKKSAVVLPTGVIFMSQKGFYLLDRALNVKYIGADVESFNSFTVNNAKMIETENQVRFNLSSGDTLVYDYYLEQWNIFKLINGVDAVNFQDRYTYILPNGQIRRETPNTFLDNTSFIPMKIETGWISMAGLQGFQRIYQFLILGTYKSPHTLQVELYRDFIDTPYQTITIPVLAAPDKYQYRIYPNIQKCEAFKLKITELQSSPYGEGCDITGIALEVGAKRGQNKLSSGASYG
jgi:hypothetical protein